MNNEDIWSEVLINIEDIALQLSSQNIKLACAESCTGGLLAAAFTSISGSSNWFDHGVVTYSNQSKMDLLNVSSETLKTHGAVSQEVAGEMSLGLLASNIALGVTVSTTGIAGPLGGTPNKPVGTVCFGLSLRSSQGVKTNTYTKYFDGDRDEIRQKAVLFVTKLLQALEE